MKQNSTIRAEELEPVRDLPEAIGARMAGWLLRAKGSKLAMLIGAGVVLVAALLIFLGCAASSAEGQFEAVMNETSAELREAYTVIGYRCGEEKYHTANRGHISVESLREEALLEVLEITDVEYVIESIDDNKDEIQAWLEVPAKGIFTVDLRKAEFLVDEVHEHVTIRLPMPELTNFTVIHEDVKKILFRNDWLNDSFATGTDLAQKMEQEGYSVGRQECLSNPYYMDSAKHAAVSMLTLLTKQLNPGYPKLQVEIEFM